jgi:hypothetical protein
MLFTRLERLEIQELSGWCIVDHAAAVIGVVDMLSSCPCLRELRLEFIWRKHIRETNSDPADEMAAIADFLPCRSMDAEEAEADCCNDLEDELQGRLGRRCKLDCLRRVVLEFDAEELTCFQVWLLRFLTKNVGTLEEVVVGGDKGYDSSRIDWKVAQWRRKRRGRPLSPPPPPPLSEFPPLEVSPCLDGELEDTEVPPCLDGELDDMDSTEALELPPCSYRAVYDDDDTEEEEEDISPRHFRHSARKMKRGGWPEYWSVKPKHTGLITAGWSRERVGRRHRRRRPSLGGGEDITAGSLPPVVSPVPPAQQSPPIMPFRLLRVRPPPAQWRSLFERRGTPLAAPCRVPLIMELLCG